MKLVLITGVSVAREVPDDEAEGDQREHAAHQEDHRRGVQRHPRERLHRLAEPLNQRKVENGAVVTAAAMAGASSQLRNSSIRSR